MHVITDAIITGPCSDLITCFVRCVKSSDAESLGGGNLARKALAAPVSKESPSGASKTHFSSSALEESLNHPFLSAKLNAKPTAAISSPSSFRHVFSITRCERSNEKEISHGRASWQTR